MGRIKDQIKISYQKVIPADFTPDIDGVFDILFTETLKDWKPKTFQLMASRAWGTANSELKKSWTYGGER